MSVRFTMWDVLDQDRFVIRPAKTPHKSRRWLWKPQVALIHATASRSVSSTLEWFENPVSGVSSDWVIDRVGQIWRPVPKGWYAWHAGTCLFKNQLRDDYNRFSYGIELVNRNDGEHSYPEVQLRALAYVLARCKVEAPSLAYVRRHADVAYPRGRKSDPAGLSISAIYEAIRRYQPQCWLE